MAQNSAEDFRLGECKHLSALPWAVVLPQIQSHLADPKAAGAHPRRMETGCTPLWRACRQHFADSSCKPAARCSQIGDQDVLDFLRVHTASPQLFFQSIPYNAEYKKIGTMFFVNEQLHAVQAEMLPDCGRRGSAAGAAKQALTDQRLDAVLMSTDEVSRLIATSSICKSWSCSS